MKKSPLTEPKSGCPRKSPESVSQNERNERAEVRISEELIRDSFIKLLPLINDFEWGGDA